MMPKLAEDRADCEWVKRSTNRQGGIQRDRAKMSIRISHKTQELSILTHGSGGTGGFIRTTLTPGVEFTAGSNKVEYKFEEFKKA